jgi:hypothetical protein
VLFVYITRLASKGILSPSNKIHWEVGRAKDLSAPPIDDQLYGVTTTKWKPRVLRDAE